MEKCESVVTQSCPTLCDPVDCSPPDSSVHGIFQARILEWVAILFYKRSSRPMDPTQVSRIAGRLFTIWATREARPEQKSILIFSPKLSSAPISTQAPHTPKPARTELSSQPQSLRWPGLSEYLSNRPPSSPALWGWRGAWVWGLAAVSDEVQISLMQNVCATK